MSSIFRSYQELENISLNSKPEPSQTSSDHLNQISNGIAFTRRLIPTYQYVLLCVLLIFSAAHFWIVIKKQCLTYYAQKISTRPARATQDEIETAAPRLETHRPFNTKSSDETSPLLRSNVDPPRCNIVSYVARKLRAVGMYQPPPIPCGERTIPHITSLAFLIALLGTNAFYMFYGLELDPVLMFLYGDRAGLLFAANLPWLYLLGAKNQPIKFLTGYSYEQVNFIHRRLGELLCIYPIIHGVFMFVGWYQVLYPQGWTLLYFISRPTILIGLLAFVAYELLFITSQPWVREWYYEVFLGSHILLQAAGLVLFYFHFPACRIYAVISLFIFFVDRLVYRMFFTTREFQADLTIMEDEETVLISTSWPLSLNKAWWSKLLHPNLLNGWEPSQHIFLSIPSMSHRHRFQSHPFTIASAAPQKGQSHAWLNLIVRAHDGFSRHLLHFAQTHPSTRIRLDGPYGSLHALNSLHKSDVSLVIAGGSGIAVAYPLLWSILHANQQASQDHSTRQVVGLIWIVHDAAHLSWIGIERLQELENLGLRLCLPSPTSKGGRPDVSALATQLVLAMKTQSGLRDPRIGIVVSGPDGMNRVVRNVCARLAWQGHDIDVCVEKYGW